MAGRRPTRNLPPSPKEGRDPGDDILDSAARLLRDQFGGWLRHLKASSRRERDEPERVHRLRVGARKAEVALDLYRDLLPRKRRHWLVRRLKRVRRSANGVRECDMLAGLLRGLPRTEATRAWLKTLSGTRKGEVKKLAAVTSRLGAGGRLARRIAGLIARVRLRGESPLGLGERLRPLAELFFTAAPAHPRDLAALHRFRILGKRFRYGLEFAAEAFPAGETAPLVRDLEDLQTALGEVNDLASAVARANRMSHASGSRAWEALRDDLRARLGRSLSAFADRFPPAVFRSLRHGVRQLLSPTRIQVE